MNTRIHDDERKPNTKIHDRDDDDRGCKHIFGHHPILMTWQLSEKLVLRRFHGNQAPP